MDRLTRLSLVAFGALCAACSSPSSTPDAQVNPPPPPSTTREVDADGATLRVESESGWGFTLDVPFAALDAGVSITITPVEHIDGFEFDAALVAALRLEPSGLVFKRPVTLTVAPPAGTVLPDDVIAFTVSGRDVEPVPLRVREGAVDVSLLHFTAVAVLPASDPVVAAELYVDTRYQRFMEWTAAYLSRDFDYFLRPGAAMDHVPTCVDAMSIAAEALVIERMLDLLGDARSLDVDGQLSAVLTEMVVGFGGADLMCGATGDDTLAMLCAAAAYRLSELTGRPFGASQRCGALVVEAAPPGLAMDVGTSQEVAFLVKDASNTALPNREVSLFLDSADRALLSVTRLDVGRYRFTCLAYGAAEPLVFDTKALQLGNPGLQVPLPVLCTYSGITLTPGASVLIGDDQVEYRVAVLDAQGREYPAGPGVGFSWYVDTPAVVVTVNPTDSSRAVVGRAADSFVIGPATLQVCAGPLFPCPVGLFVALHVVPDVRGRWLGTGGFSAWGCADSEDDGPYSFDNWTASFTQTLDGPMLTSSHFTATFSGTGVGVGVFGPLAGTMNEAGQLSGSLNYSGGGAGGNATFTGSISVPAKGHERLEFDFTFQDTHGDTCQGGGQVAFTHAP